MSKVLITGASGLVGTRLTQLLLEKGYEVTHLGRSRKPGSIPSFVWDVEKGTMETEAFSGIDVVVHLAGEGIADKRWTKKRKRAILESRTKSTAMVVNEINKPASTVHALISASATGYYGMTLDSREFTESSPPGTDFLADVVTAWEHEADQVNNKRVVKIRTGIVLSEHDAALKQMARPVRLGIGAPLGTGEQYVSWIHLDDLCEIYIKAIEDTSLNGVYNATTGAVTNRELTKAIAKTLHKPLWLPNVPGFALKLVLGEMADVVVLGNNVTSDKIRKAGFSFRFDTLEKALADLLKR